MARVRFYNKTKDEICYGTFTENGDIICDCCGDFIEKDSDEYEVLETWIFNLNNNENTKRMMNLLEK